MFHSQSSLAWLLVLTSGLGIGVLSSLPLVVWILYSLPKTGQLAASAKSLFALISTLSVSAPLGLCIYLSFKLASVANSSLEISGPLAFEWLCGTSLIGLAIPGFAVIKVTYDWSRHYNIPALKRFGRSFGLIALAVMLANIAANYLIPKLEPIIFLGSLFLWVLERSQRWGILEN